MTDDLIGQFGYLGIVLLLVLGGLGVPIPEEAPIVLSAILSHKGAMIWYLALGACFAGVLLGDEGLTGGDFVRTTKQLIDLLRQLGDAAGNRATAASARRAADAIHRGVVAASSTISTGDGDDDDDTGGAGTDDTAGGVDAGVDGLAEGRRP